jgi:hypothetical protein
MDLSSRDYILVLDSSGSMGNQDGTSKSRWDRIKETTHAVVKKLVELDDDGITVYSFASSFKKFENVKDQDSIDAIFKKDPIGSTVLAPVLKDIFGDFFKNRKKPLTVFVITDGEAEDRNETCKEIIAATKKMEADEELSLEFLQVGKDPAAKEFLRKLDDDLEKADAKFDIIDTKTMDELENSTIEEIIIASIND